MPVPSPTSSLDDSEDPIGVQLGDSNPLSVSPNSIAAQEVTTSQPDPLAHSLAREIEKHPDLHRVLDAWPTLPEALRAGILAMIDAAGKTGRNSARP